MEGKRVEMYYCHSVFSRKSKFGDLNCNSVLETAKTKERKKERKKYSLTTADLNIQTLSISPPPHYSFFFLITVTKISKLFLPDLRLTEEGSRQE